MMNLFFEKILLPILLNLFSSDIYNNFANTDKGLINKIEEAYSNAVNKYNSNHSDCKISSVLKDGIALLDSNNELKSYFLEELSNISGILYYYEIAIDKYRANYFVNSLLKMDERYHLKYQEKFMDVFYDVKIPIDRIRVDPDYTIWQIENLKPRDITKNNPSFEIDCKEILRNEKVLFLFGPYGCGKTFLSKYLLSMINDGYSLFIYSRNLSLDGEDLFSTEAIDYLIKGYGNLYVFLDSCEDILLNENYAILEKMANLQKQFDNLYFIINLRKLEGKVLDELYTSIEYNLGTSSIIELKYFNKNSIGQWLDLYDTIARENGLNINCNYEDIKNANKNLRTSCSIPLILLMMSLSQNNYLSNTTQSWYDLFDNFVQKTIRGKFLLEKKENYLLTKRNKKKEYITFINKVASRIFIKSQNKLNIEEYDDDDFYLDPNKSNYTISNSDIEDIVKKILDENAKSNDALQYLNCYFFEYRNGYWMFKDNNILFFLCAANLCDSLFKILSKIDNNENIDKSVDDFISDFKDYPLHPVVIEFVLDKICSSNKIDDILYLIEYLFEKNYIINIPVKEEFKINYDKIKMDVFLSILFIHFNKEYRKINHYFKRISQYYSFVKLLNEDLASIIRRYFRNLYIIDAEFRRINFKGYNFTHSKFKNVKFIQCKIKDTLLNGNSYEGVLFDMCFINDNNIKISSGKVKFKTCELRKITIELMDNISLQFDNCIIDNVRIINSTNLRSYIFLNCCDVRQFVIEQGKIDFYNNYSNIRHNIRLANVRVAIVENNSNDTLNSIERKFRKDNNSEITLKTRLKSIEDVYKLIHSCEDKDVEEVPNIPGKILNYEKLDKKLRNDYHIKIDMNRVRSCYTLSAIADLIYNETLDQ